MVRHTKYGGFPYTETPRRADSEGPSVPHIQHSNPQGAVTRIYEECKTLCGFDQGAFDRSVSSKQLLFGAEICLYSYISGEFHRCVCQYIHCTGSLPRGLGTLAKSLNPAAFSLVPTTVTPLDERLLLEYQVPQPQERSQDSHLPSTSQEHSWQMTPIPCSSPRSVGRLVGGLEQTCTK